MSFRVFVPSPSRLFEVFSFGNTLGYPTVQRSLELQVFDCVGDEFEKKLW